MPEEIESQFLAIYKRIAPQFNIPHVTAVVEGEETSVPEIIELTSDTYSFAVCLSLYSETDEEDIKTYRWEYLDCCTGALIKSDLTYKATDEEVIAFFYHTVQNDESVMDLPE